MYSMTLVQFAVFYIFEKRFLSLMLIFPDCFVVEILVMGFSYCNFRCLYTHAEGYVCKCEGQSKHTNKM